MTRFRTTHDLLAQQLSGPDKYEPRFVAFIDILGFANVVERADLDRALREKLAIQLRWTKPLNSEGRHDFKIRSFSDSIVCSVKQSPESAIFLLESIVELQFAMLSLDVLLRGAVAAGSLFIDDDVIFGTGLNAAYAAEQSVATHPRVILTAPVVSYLQEKCLAHRAAGDRCTLRDEDGVYFLHYLHDLVAFNQSRSATPKSQAPKNSEEANWVWVASQIHSQITKRLDETVASPRIFAKAQWLAKYWNRVMRLEPALVQTVPLIGQSSSRRLMD